MDKTGRPGTGRSRAPQIDGALVSPFLFVKKAVWLCESNEAHAAS